MWGHFSVCWSTGIQHMSNERSLWCLYRIHVRMKTFFSETIQSIFICVLMCQCFNWAQALFHQITWCTQAVSNMSLYTEMWTVRQQSYKTQTTHSWFQHIQVSGNSCSFKEGQSNTKQFFCCSEMFWLQWSLHTKSDSWQFRPQAQFLWADTPHQDHLNDPEKHPWLKIKRVKGQE